MKPVIVIVGRPNVGKSTLFNRLTRSRLALVADAPGLTRDRQYGDGRVGDRPYLVVDTGGVADRLAGALGDDMTKQTQQAIAEADAVLFVVDGASGLVASERELSAQLRRSGKPIYVAVNKVEGREPETAIAEFHALGLGAPSAISARHGDGVAGLMERVLVGLPVVDESGPPADVPKVAIVGRPNVGKSTLVNALLGEERVIVYDEGGTTRDAIHVPFERNAQQYVLIDTAGVRRRTKVSETIEKFSVVKTLQAIDESDVCILVIDAHAGVGDQDVALAGHILEQGRALVLAINKWDLLDVAQRAWVRREVNRKLPFADYVRVHEISAKRGSGLAPLFDSIREAYAAACVAMSTARLNRILGAAVQATPPPMLRGRRIRPKYAHQGGRRPPTIIVHGNLVDELSDAYRRYLANAFRRAFGLVGTPVRIECRAEDNPYRPKRAVRRATRRPARARSRVKQRV
ncbi:MAG: ribosome biogenesis GTPase Der [Pseudomonadota bacterium]|nr:MAG: ribosome biogenesis GTPase Der [Pseudomonadota bacterium]